jgi:hypothetical protein
MRRKPTTPSARAGRTTCLRCERHFESWDRRQNRICPSCHETMAEQPSDEPSYTIDLPNLRAALRSAFRHVAD